MNNSLTQNFIDKTFKSIQFDVNLDCLSRLFRSIYGHRVNIENIGLFWPLTVDDQNAFLLKKINRNYLNVVF